MTIDQVLEEYRPHLMRRLAAFGVEHEDAEDILQDAWLKLQTQPPPRDGNWVPFVLQVVKSLSMNLIRNDDNRRRLEEDK